MDTIDITHSETFECKEADLLHQLTEISTETVIILDFDETLLIRNSTEEYLDTLKPRFLGALLLMVLDKTKPWQHFPKEFRTHKTRDWTRVLVATLLFPWTLIFWRNKAKKIAEQYENQELAQAVSSNPSLKPIIVSQGFNFIIEPIARNLSIAITDIVACRFWKGMHDRQKGKETLIGDRLDASQLSQSIVVTDSLDDSSLLAVVKHPYLVKWPDAAYIPAMSNIYIPIRYYERVKRPGEKPFLNTIIKNHFITLIFALSWLSSAPIIHAGSMFFLLLSFWCVYEIGYFENDQIAEKHEKKPNLSETYHQYKAKIEVWQPWFCTFLFSAFGIGLLEISRLSTWPLSKPQDLNVSLAIDWQSFSLQFFVWIAVLLLTRITFWVYNYLDKKTRSWLYPLLQIYKYFGFTAVFATNIVGSTLLFTQVLVEWVPYLIYRSANVKYDIFQHKVFRIVTFVCLSVSLAVAYHDISIVVSLQFLVIVLWCLLKSRSQLKEVFDKAYPIWKDTSQ